tara:strand:+ start:1 stop:1116 length:1116 start_codon:yes stop_codon:yes gene_type:complete
MKSYSWQGDKRFNRFTKKGKNYTYSDSRGQEYEIDFKGAKLYFKGKSGKLDPFYPYLRFTSKPKKKITISKKAEAFNRWFFKLPKDKMGTTPKKLLDGTIVGSVDLSFRNSVGFITISRKEKDGLRQLCSRNIHLTSRKKHNGKKFLGPNLFAIASVERELKDINRTLSRNQFPDRLARHRKNMKDEYIKRSSRAIIDYVLNLDGRKDDEGNVIPPVDIMVLEDLTGLTVNTKKTKKENQMISDFSRSRFYEFIEQIASINGIYVTKIYPGGSSRVCNNCNHVGVRFKLKNNNIFFRSTGKRFYCPHCGREYDADYNASINIADMFMDRKKCMRYWDVFKNSPDRKKLEKELQDKAEEKFSIISEFLKVSG